MNSLRLRWLPCVLSLFVAVPLLAQDQAPPVPPRTIPDGITFLIRLDDKLDTAKLKPGKHFKAKLAEDLIAPDGSTIRRG